MINVPSDRIVCNNDPVQYQEKGFIDLTGAFPHNSRRGNLYVMVVYDYDSNTILSKPIKKFRQKPSGILYSKFTRY